MELLAIKGGLFSDFLLTKTTLRIMKLSAVLLFAISLNISANVNSQTVTFSGKNVSIEKVFREVRKQTGYLIFCSYDVLGEARTVSINARDMALEEFLRTVLKSQLLDFSIENKTILIRKLGRSSPESGIEIPVPLPPPITVSGRVVTENGDPLAGATVRVRGSSGAVTTSETGSFSITVPSAGSVIEVSYVGYETFTVTVQDARTLSITLTQKDNTASEIVVIGYGTQRKSDLTGSVSSVSMKAVEEIPMISVDQILNGRAPGVQINQSSGKAGAGTSIRIRGGNSLNGTNEPLFVIDGFPIINDNSSFSPAGPVGLTNQAGGTNQENPNGALNWLNPDDIQSIEILKDASATAIYGSRGANGVVMITTKKGRSGQARVNLNASFGGSKLRDDNIKLMNAREYATYLNLSNIQRGMPAYYNDMEVNGKFYPAADKLGEGTNWVEPISQTGLSQNYSLGFSGGSDVLVSGSLSWLDQETSLKGSRFKRMNFRLNMQTDLTKWLTLDNGFMYSESVTNNSPSDTRDVQKFGGFEAALLANPVEPVYNEDGSLNATGSGDPSNILIPGLAFSPVALLTHVLNKNSVNTVLNNLSLNARIADGINFQVRGSVFKTNSLRDLYYPQSTYNGWAVGGLAGKNTNNVSSYLIENFATINKNFGVNAFTSVLGYSYQTTQYNSVVIGASGFPNDNLKNENLASGNTQYPTQSNKIEDLLSSYYVRLNNIIDDKYLFTFTARMDGSSKFGTGNKWAFFPSGAFSWKLMNENFMKGSNTFTDLKLRVSYGISGNQAIQSLQSKTLLGVNNYPIGGVLQTGVYPAVLGNSNLKWETTKQFNVGLDFGIINQRVTGSIDYYVKNTDDLLQTRSIPANSGFTSQLDNLGSISNKGIELGLQTTPVVTPNFRWNLDLNLTHNKQKFTDIGLPGVDTSLRSFVAVGGQESGAVALIKGQPVGVFYGYIYEGIYASQAEVDNSPHLAGAVPGSVRFTDVNGDGAINGSDRTIIGDPNPDLIYGIINNFSYKKFDLNILIQGVLGGDIYNVSSLRQIRLGNLPEAYNDYWTPQNTDAKYPAPGWLPGTFAPSSLQVESATFLRLKSITLGYNITSPRLKFLRNFRVYASAANLLTFTNYSGFDPEINTFAQSNIFRNIDNLTIPLDKIVTIGLNVGF